MVNIDYTMVKHKVEKRAYPWVMAHTDFFYVVRHTAPICLQKVQFHRNHIEGGIQVKHSEIYVFITHYCPKLGISDKQAASILSEKIGKNVTERDVELFRTTSQPKSGQVVKAFVDAGFSQADIVRITGLSQPTVSHHMAKDYKTSLHRDYVNPYWKASVDDYKHNDGSVLS
jgi:DNA-binding transcriptional ArsR family regulator